MTAGDRRRGTVLVTVLWSIALLSALAMAASLSFRAFAGIAAVGRDRIQDDALLTAGLEVAAGMVASLGDKPLTDVETIINLSTGTVRARLSDEGGRIDIGKAPVEVLASLLRSVGAPEARANDAAQSIVDWRNRDAVNSPDAAARPVNDTGKRPSGEQPFADVLQLAQVPGVAPQWVAAMGPLTTVFGSETVNQLTAPAGVIAALPGVDGRQLEAFLAARRSFPTDAERISAVLGSAQRYVAAKRQQVLSVELSAMLTDGYAGAARAVIVVMPQDSQPYRVMVWKPLPSSLLR
jgi:general secretion pathway protein K